MVATVTLSLAELVALLQDSEKVVVVASATASLPSVALVPDQPPDATQPVAPVDDQLNTTLSPSTTEVALAARLTVTETADDSNSKAPTSTAAPLILALPS